ncbi:hypothetical protein Tco_1081398 [Tanacetum coccineum]|uniref:Uncharacterized protein n=1 Tax=Tanacetum coccineum TaxID=301880 RepID=A0ABQ5HXK9_9ASTR
MEFGGSLSSQVLATPSRENGKRRSLMVVLAFKPPPWEPWELLRGPDIGPEDLVRPLGIRISKLRGIASCPVVKRSSQLRLSLNSNIPRRRRHENEEISYTDYALWEVIVNGDAPTVASASAEGPIPLKTAEQKLERKNELKAKSTLLLAIPDENLLKFHGIKDAKTLWEAIKTRFGGNKESKKMQKTILKQQYENFTASRSKGLDKTYDMFQKLISQLQIHGEVIS